MLNSISKLIKFISSRFLLFILGIFLATGATYVYATWTSPTLAPPEGNIAALINTSNTGQAKQGGLILNTGGSANGLIVQFGNVGIGTTSPGAKLEVVGNIIADAPTASDHLATKGYVDASGGGGGCFDQYHYPWCTTHQNEKCAKSGTMDYKCIGDFCTKASISNDMDGDGITAATDCDDDDIIIVAAVDGTCDGDADGKIDQTAYTTVPKPALADCYDSDPTKYLCLSNGTTTSSGIYCASTIRVDGVCCNNSCEATCAACNVSGGIGTCSNIPNDTDPSSECSDTTCSNYIYGGTNPSCYRYASATSHNGMCNGAGVCYTSLADSCEDQGSATITCGNTACWKACVADSPVTSYDNYSEVCYTSGTQECTGGLACDAVGACKKPNGIACTAGSECVSTYCVDSTCCNTACTGSTCQRCDSNSNAGAGTCGYIKTAVDPDNECPGAFGTCTGATCSGSGYACGYLAVGQQGCSTCLYCTGSSYSCTAVPNANWNAGTYGCTGYNKRCYSGSCVTCGGWMNAGYCWYNGANKASCNTTCTTRGGVYNGNCNWVNDPSDCSTCLHFYPGKSCGGPNGFDSPSWFYNAYWDCCSYYRNSGNTCDWYYTDCYNHVRQCACNQ